MFQADSLCKECFFYCFEIEIHETIVRGKLFKRGDTVAIGASGGKGIFILMFCYFCCLLTLFSCFSCVKIPLFSHIS